MKYLSIPLLVLAAAAHTHAAGEEKDSVVATTVAVTPPECVLPSNHAELNDLITSMKFSKADAAAKKLINTARRRREPTKPFDEVISICQKGESGLRGVDRVIVVDSVVVNKKTFLSAYPLSPEMGTLTLIEKGDAVQYQTQINGMVLRPERMDQAADTPLQIVKYFQENGKLVEPEPVDGLGIEGDTNYPYLMPDGQMLYFAARSEDGFGNYDLYATRYDADNKRFYRAENMGYPYNSYANDYMLVIDEDLNLGWFASDRYQPADSVCIYTFIPNESRHTIDYETTDTEEVRAAASLHSIAAIALSDEDKQAKKAAQHRLKTLSRKTDVDRKHDFEFVLNDAKTCYTLSDFSSEEAKKLCGDWIQKSKNLIALTEQLQQLRMASPSAKQQILNLEKRIVELQDELHGLEKSIRRAEGGACGK